MPRPAAKIPRSCATCGNQFLAFRAEVKRQGGKYCSRACTGAGLSQQAKDHNQKILCKCLRCGTEFTVKPSRVKDGKAGKYCSHSCRSKNRARPALERFLKRFTKADNGCWIWLGAAHPYGGFSLEPGKKVGAHQAAWLLLVGPIPKGLFVCHNCPTGDNPRCVNPAHLWLGSSADNTHDAQAKGLMPHGERHWTQRKPHHRDPHTGRFESVTERPPIPPTVQQSVADGNL